MKQYEDLKASFLYCRQCERSMPVRERLLLVLPEGNVWDYVCCGCGSVVGDKKTKLSGADSRLL